MDRLSRITQGAYRKLANLPSKIFGGPGCVPGTLSPGNISKPLTLEQIEQVNLLEKYFALTLRCLRGGGERILVWDILEKFGNELSDESKNAVNAFNSAKCNKNIDITSKDPSNIPSKEKIIDFLNIPIKKDKIILEEFGKFTQSEILFILHDRSYFYIGREYSFDTEDLSKFYDNILAYYIYKDEISDLLNSHELMNKNKLRLGIEIVHVLIKLKKTRRAAIFLGKLLEETKPGECVFESSRNLLFQVLEPLESLIPEILKGEGLSLIIKRYKELGSPIEKDDLIVNAGFIYPQNIVEKVASSADPLAAALLRLGHVLFECRQDSNSAFQKFTAFCKDIGKQPSKIKTRIGSQVKKRKMELSIPMKVEVKFREIRPDESLIQPDIETDTILPDTEEDPAAVSLRDEVRESNKLLLFTRNIDLEEFKDIAQNNVLRKNGEGKKYFRYGLGHEYGEEGAVITLVMRESFWKTEKEKSKLENIWLSEINGEEIPEDVKVIPLNKKKGARGPVFVVKKIKEEVRDSILKKLARNAEYNRYLRQKESDAPWVQGIRAAGKSIVPGDEDKYMGMFPQLEVKHDIPLDQVERIMIPEHMWDGASQIAQQNKQIGKLLYKVEGTGKTKKDFLRGRNLMTRRSRLAGGSIDPNSGYLSFFISEQAYFRLVLGEKRDTYVSQLARSAFVDSVKNLMKEYGYDPFCGSAWIEGYVKDTQVISRKGGNDWKIFVNPKEEKFLEVLKAVLAVLKKNSELGINIKVPADFSQEWRKGRKFSDSASPKIVIYVNEKSLSGILKMLNNTLKEHLNNAGFGDEPGPSFAKRYGETDLLLYKKEYFGVRGDARAEIANEAEDKTKALEEAGFTGENFYRRTHDLDPVSMGRIIMI